MTDIQYIRILIESLAHGWRQKAACLKDQRGYNVKHKAETLMACARQIATIGDQIDLAARRAALSSHTTLMKGEAPNNG
ncbi:hypothetical protein [Stenotrophomonas sp.]|uniref:hypothetical protein n=1 Tax=Stenotrophomonas sp. TaxID=69392 RepID=UPI00289C4494|nr:hypothetical protein [Stenotrophomonas sp.]